MWIRSLLVTSAVGVAMLVSGCGGSNGTADASPAQAAVSGCTKAEVRDRVQAFVAALRKPKPAQLRAAWGDRFKWFSATRAKGRKKKWHFVAYKRGKALRWVKVRGGLPLRINKIGGGAKNPKTRGHEGFRYEGRWGRKAVIGKGDMLCGSPEIRVWSMAINSRPLY